MSKIKIAVIDDGVYPNANSNITVKRKMLVTENLNIIPDKEVGALGYYSHGTICAEIISSQCEKSISIISIKIIDSDNRSYVEQLICALDWCSKNDIKLINMSLGTSDYYDGLKLQPIINRMIDQNIILVAAFSNLNVISWPAGFKNVIGVRYDRNNEREIGKIYIDKNYLGNLENSFVVSADANLLENEIVNFLLVGANSFAAPTITGFLINSISENTTIKECIKLLVENSLEHRFVNLFNFFPCSKYKTEVPIIYAESDIINKLVECFEKDDYIVVAFTDKTEFIPLSLYAKSESLAEPVFRVLEKIYFPDVMIFSFDGLANKNLFDAFVCNDYTITLKSLSVQCESIDEIYNVVIKNFE